jgi:hypothetical protein
MEASMKYSDREHPNLWMLGGHLIVILLSSFKVHSEIEACNTWPAGAIDD